MIILMGVFDSLFHRSKLSLKHVFALFAYIFVVWAIYRHFPESLPVWAEELILKPLTWLLPTFLLVVKIENQPLSSLGLTKKNLFASLYWGIGLGMVFAFEGFLTNIFKYRGLGLMQLNYDPATFLGLLALSFVTAFSEETVFRGYLFGRLWKIWGNEGLANLVSALLFVLIHLPIGIFVLGYAPVALAAYLFFVLVYGFGAAFVFARTNNLVSSILLHVFWSWPIILFR
jgi:membrane protease YdiL (CAAX protease family)